MKQPNGFTLLEVLIALAVLGFLFVGLVQGVNFGLLAWTHAVRLTSSNDEFDAVDDTLRHLIENADPGDDLDPAPFSSSANRLNCITALPSALGPTPHRHMQAALLIDANHRLVLRWRPYVRATRLGSPPPFTETELLRGVSRIELAFWRPGSSWTSVWHLPDLPALVRIRLLFPAGDRRHWPDIVAAPRFDRP